MTNLVVGGAVERAGGELRPDLEPKSKVRFGSTTIGVNFLFREREIQFGALLVSTVSYFEYFHLSQCHQQARCSDGENPPSTNKMD